MNGWVVAAVLAAVVGVGLIVLVVFVYKAVLSTAENARQLAIALEEVQQHTIVLSELEAQSAATSKLMTDASWALQKLQQHEADKKDPDPDGH